jgi:hypothetical protein
MELFGLHIPDAFFTAAIALYGIAVVVGLLACVMRGWLWGKWRWYLLSVAGAAFLLGSTCPEVVGTLLYIPLVLLFMFLLGKWRKLDISRMEYFLMAFFTFPMAGAFILLLIFVWVEVLGNRLC